jgi:hypothetical protein
MTPEQVIDAAVRHLAADRPLDFDLGDWAVRYQGERRPLLTRKHWDRIWRERGASQSAQVAFRWSPLPTVQHFEPVVAEIPDIRSAPDR